MRLAQNADRQSTAVLTKDLCVTLSLRRSSKRPRGRAGERPPAGMALAGFLGCKKTAANSRKPQFRWHSSMRAKFRAWQRSSWRGLMNPTDYRRKMPKDHCIPPRPPSRTKRNTRTLLNCSAGINMTVHYSSLIGAFPNVSS